MIQNHLFKFLRNFSPIYFFRCWLIFSAVNNYPYSRCTRWRRTRGILLNGTLRRDEMDKKRSNFGNLEINLAILLLRLLWNDVKIRWCFLYKEQMVLCRMHPPTLPCQRWLVSLLLFLVAQHRKKCILFAANWFTRISRFKHKIRGL